ncbi:MAG TPA: hypothetical protein V6D29_03630 [Leptolyngbyaceae cyanobacterium]
MGKPDYAGNPAVHYAVLTLTDSRVEIAMGRVEYDSVGWANRLSRRG